jgi:hypothetical protein
VSNQRKNNILFLPGDYPFCYYYRGFLPGVYSNSLVFKDFVAFGQFPSPQEISERVKMADTIVFQRPNNERMFNLAQILKSEGRKVIYENDDTYKVGKGIILERLENEKQRDIARKMSYYNDLFLKLADGVIASTDFLAKEYSELNDNVVVLKNCIDPLDKFDKKENKTGKFRIGFVGSVTSNDDYFHIKDQILRLSERDDIQIVILGAKYANGANSTLPFVQDDIRFWSSVKNIEWHPYVPVTHFMSKLSDLALDLAVIPREDSYFNRAKSNLKFLEMSLFKIPVLAQGFSDGQSPYQKDGDYVNIILDNNTWHDKILEIKGDYEKYSLIAKQAQDYVLKEYNIEFYAPEWVTKINNLIK